MPDDVKSALHNIIQQHGQMSSEEANNYIHHLEQARRYQAETWNWAKSIAWSKLWDTKWRRGTELATSVVWSKLGDTRWKCGTELATSVVWSKLGDTRWKCGTDPLWYYIAIKSIYPTSKVVCCNNVLVTVESSLFVGDQCSWISWVTLTHEFTSPRTCFIFRLIFINIMPFALFINYHEITSPRTSKILVNHEHWPSRIKMILQYLRRKRNGHNTAIRPQRWCSNSPSIHRGLW